MEFRSLEGQEMYTSDKIVPLKDTNNFDSDPKSLQELFAKIWTFEIFEVAPAVAVAIREQLYEFVMKIVFCNTRGSVSATKNEPSKRLRKKQYYTTKEAAVPKWAFGGKMCNKIPLSPQDSRYT
ncbi:hypothetical protein Syun_029658 [Stephania yunnanensis]|uniref:Uncharacterized protein n=1 Tax=Stephania yunnanensis TaxID=152371 RepID=A0AAP0EE91_9MAGN